MASMATLYQIRLQVEFKRKRTSQASCGSGYCTNTSNQISAQEPKTALNVVHVPPKDPPFASTRSSWSSEMSFATEAKTYIISQQTR